MGCLGDTVAGRPGDQMMGRSGTPVTHVFKSQLRNIFNLL